MKKLCICIGLALIVSVQSLASVRDCANPVNAQLVNGTSMMFCEISGGKNVRIGEYENSKPRRDFEIFYIGQYEVTQQQFKAIMGYEPWKNTDGSPKYNVTLGDNIPAVFVSHEEAVSFASSLSILDKNATYRLPTEAEWEHAARGKEYREATHYWGDFFTHQYAFKYSFCSLNSQNEKAHARSVLSCPDTVYNSSRPGYCANDFGLMHMLGNVSEWTADVYVDSFANAPINGHTPVVIDRSKRVQRGGSWLNIDFFLNSHDRSGLEVNFSSSRLGFRLVRVPNEVKNLTPHNSYNNIRRCANPVETQLNGDVGMVFCEVQGGKSVKIGKSNSRRDLKTFHIGRYEVTQEQFKSVMGYEPWIDEYQLPRDSHSVGKTLPANYISYEEARKFADAMTKLDNSATYRLPTEAEWEHAARGKENRDTKYYWGNEIDPNFTFNIRNSGEHSNSVFQCPNSFLDERQKGYCANDYGLMHMLGNVEEWTTNENGFSETKPDKQSVLRGGNFYTGKHFATVFDRNPVRSTFQINFVGFRLVRIPNK